MKYFILIFLLTGCSGSSFTGSDETQADDAGDAMVGSGGHPSMDDAPSSGGTPSTGGSTASSGGSDADAGDGCALVTHKSGLGQTWQDCVPLHTYTESQAMKACEAYCAVNGSCKCIAGPPNNSYCHGVLAYTQAVNLIDTVWAGKDGTYTGSIGVFQINLTESYPECSGLGMWD